MDCPPDAEQVEQRLNKSGVKGNLIFPKFPEMYQLCANPYVETNDWDWEIDPYAMRYSFRYLWNLYHLPMMVAENGYGGYDILTEDERIHDTYRIDFLRDQIYQLGMAIEDGCQVIGYNLWSFTDLLSTGNGLSKRYGLVYVNTSDNDVLDLRRIKKDSFYWYSRLIRSNGQEWGE